MDTPTELIDSNNKKAIFQASAETQALRLRFSKMAMGELITDDEVAIVIGAKVKKRYSVCISAVRNVLSEHSIVLERVAKTGWRRLEDSSIVKTGATGIRKIARMSKRVLRKTLAADYKKLSRDEQIQQNAQQATLGTLAYFSGGAQQKTLQIETAARNSKLEIGDTLKLFAPK